MKIAVLGAKGLPPKQGGIEHYCAEVYPRMVAQGHSVDLYARSSYTQRSAYHRQDFKGVRVISLPCPGICGFDAFFSTALGAISCTFKNYDVVHFHALGPSLFTWLPKIASSSKIVVTCHGLDWQRDKWGKLSSRLIRLGQKAAVRFADEITVVSQDLHSYFKHNSKRSTVYIPNGPASYADSDPHFSYGTSLGLTRNHYIVFLGRLVPEKCPDLPIEAFQILQPQGWKLVLVGGNSDTNTYAQQLLQIANNSNIVFTGELRGSCLAEIIRGSGLFILPSNVEGLPLAMLEAMNEGIPVLASDIPPHKQLIGEEDAGLLFESGNVESCVRQLAWAIQHPEEMKEMAEAARLNIRDNYNWSNIVDKTLEVYRSVRSQ